MPAIETSDLHQKAVLWAASGVDDYGEHKVLAAVEINVRWEKVRHAARNSLSNVVVVDSLVVVDRVIPIGSIMWLGELDDLPDTLIDLHQVVDRNEVPDIKGREFRRTVSLARYSDELPTLV